MNHKIIIEITIKEESNKVSQNGSKQQLNIDSKMVEAAIPHLKAILPALVGNSIISQKKEEDEKETNKKA